MQPKTNIDGVSKLPIAPMSGRTAPGSVPASSLDPAKSSPKTAKTQNSQTVTLTVIATILVTVALAGLAYYAYSKSK